jgi:hypothetical protein
MSKKQNGKSRVKPVAERRKKPKKGTLTPLAIRSDAAGIDVGATELFVAVSPEKDSEPVRCFGTFTRDLSALADWLQQCGIRTVAMESTGVYWIPIFQILEDRGLEVCLVNARHLRNVPGRKTDDHKRSRPVNLSADKVCIWSAPMVKTASGFSRYMPWVC